MKLYRKLYKTDLSKVETEQLEQARDELTADLANDNVHQIERNDIMAFASKLFAELEKRKGGREKYQAEMRKKQGIKEENFEDNTNYKQRKSASQHNPTSNNHNSPQPDDQNNKKSRSSGIMTTVLLLVLIIVGFILIVILVS
jgi:flagellar basal body-associated protein FliL